jgi:phosphohistidine phosphatase SixA
MAKHGLCCAGLWWAGWILVLGLSNAVHADQTAFWQALASGGKVVLVRHAAVDGEFGDPFILDESCFSERNLSEAGKAQARAIGKAFRQRAIAVDAVLTSPHCRTRDTAEVAFWHYEVAPMLRLIRALPAEKAQANLDRTRQRISAFSGEGNLVLVTHRPNIGELIYHRLEPGEMAVLLPMGQEGGDPVFDLIAVHPALGLD